MISGASSRTLSDPQTTEDRAYIGLAALQTVRLQHEEIVQRPVPPLPCELWCHILSGHDLSLRDVLRFSAVSRETHRLVKSEVILPFVRINEPTIERFCALRHSWIPKTKRMTLDIETTDQYVL